MSYVGSGLSSVVKYNKRTSLELVYCNYAPQRHHIHYHYSDTFGLIMWLEWCNVWTQFCEGVLEHCTRMAQRCYLISCYPHIMSCHTMSNINGCKSTGLVGHSGSVIQCDLKFCYWHWMRSAYTSEVVWLWFTHLQWVIIQLAVHWGVWAHACNRGSLTVSTVSRGSRLISCLCCG